MATIAELEKQIKTIKNSIADIESNTEILGKDKYSYKGKTYTKTQLDSLKKPLKIKLDSLNKVYEPYGSAMAELARSKEIAASPITESPTGISKVDIDKNVKTAEEKVKTATKNLSGIDISKDVVVATPPASAADFRKAEGFAPGKKKQEPAKPKVPGKPGLPVAVGTVKTINGVKNTWDGTKWVPDTAATAKKAVDWEPKFREMFGKQAWLLDLDRTKYPQLFKLLQDGVTNEMWLTPESVERFTAQLDNTDFFVELKTNDTVKNIKSLVGDLGFDTIPFNSFLKNAMNFGWKDDTLKKEVYKEAFRKDPATGNYINPTTIERVRKSTPYLTVSAVGKSFFNTVSDDTVSKVLTGEMLTDDVVRQQRELAKGKYGHLTNLIDQGLSLVDIADSYKTSASRLLEKDPNSIDMSQGAYSTAFDFGEEGKKRLMTTSEWEVKLRSDATFGWDKTQNARDEARALSSTIAQAFGRVI